MSSAMSSGSTGPSSDAGRDESAGPPPAFVMAIVWLWVLVPFAYGVYELILKLQKLFS